MAPVSVRAYSGNSAPERLLAAYGCLRATSELIMKGPDPGTGPTARARCSLPAAALGCLALHSGKRSEAEGSRT
jgi:hypothetical protein